MYWTPAQMLAQHSITGCRLVPGDLIGTGTISGPTRADLASFFELSTVGKEPITLPNGETREFIDDGDEIAFFGRCERGGFVSIGFGPCMGDRKSTRLNSSHKCAYRMPYSACKKKQSHNNNPKPIDSLLNSY